MSSNNYIPKNNVAFCDWVKTMTAHASANHERWGVEPFDLGGKLERLEKLAHLCTTSKRTAEDTVERNTLRRDVEDEVRGYLQGMVMRNRHVTDLDRTAMGLSLRDTVRTPAGDPAGQAEADVAYPGRTQLMLRIRHVEGTPADAKANYGCRIYYGVFAPGQPLPAAGKELRESRFTRLKTAVFCIRYENSKGKAGQWGPLFSAVIP